MIIQVERSRAMIQIKETGTKKQVAQMPKR